MRHLPRRAWLPKSQMKREIIWLQNTLQTLTPLSMLKLKWQTHPVFPVRLESSSSHLSSIFTHHFPFLHILDHNLCETANEVVWVWSDNVTQQFWRPRTSLFPGPGKDCWPSHLDQQPVSPMRAETAPLCFLPKCVVQAQCIKTVHSVAFINLDGVNQMHNLARITNKSKPSVILAPSSFVCPCHLLISGPKFQSSSTARKD